jgi:phosphoserine aminotransferase
MLSTFFTPGPAQLHPQLNKYMQEALDMQLCASSHRSALFRKVYAYTDEQLRILMNIPRSHSIFFASSATEIWERLLLNLVDQHSFHLVNGAFSSKCLTFAKALHKQAVSIEVSPGQGFAINEISIPAETELICTTQNETSTGVITPEQDLEFLKKQFPKALLCTDLVSTAPYANINYAYMDSAYFSVQKAFGMPAGLGVWIANDACISKSEILKGDGINIGAHNTLGAYARNYKNFETPSTPNMLAIYVLGKIAADYNAIGIDKIRAQTMEKAKYIYESLENHENFEALVKNKLHQSQTVAVFETKISSATIIHELKKQHLVIGSGYANYKDAHIRIANFPNTTMQELQKLMPLLKAII